MAGEGLAGAPGYLQGKPCPKCGYARTAADINPAWQCPKCRIAYAKFRRGTARLGPRLVAGSREMAAEARQDSSVFVLIAANLVALAIAWKTGMSLHELMLVYWIQSVIIGICSAIRILSLERSPPRTSGSTTSRSRRNRPASGESPGSSFCTTASSISAT